MVSSSCQCPGVEGKVCNRILPSKDNDPHHLCCSCHGKTCSLDGRCEECHDWSDDGCQHVCEYMLKLSLQRERKAKASSSSSFSVFFCHQWLCPHVSYHLLQAQMSLWPPLLCWCVRWCTWPLLCCASGRYTCGTGPQVASCGIARETQEDACGNWGYLGCPLAFITSSRSIYSPAACDSSCSSHDYACLWFQLRVQPRLLPLCLPIRIHLPTWPHFLTPWSCRGLIHHLAPVRSRPRLARSPSFVPGPVTHRPVGGPIPEPHHLPAPRLLPALRLLPAPVRLFRRPNGRKPVPIAHHSHGGHGTVRHRVRGQSLPCSRRLQLRPWVPSGLLENLVRHWTLFRFLILMWRCEPLTAGGLLPHPLFALVHKLSCSPVSRGHHSCSRSHSCSHRSPSAGASSSRVGSQVKSPVRYRSSRFLSRTSSR